MKRLICASMVFVLVLSISACLQHGDSDLTGTLSVSGDSASSSWTTDTWRVSAPELQGLNAEMLGKADEKIRDNYPNVYSLLVIRYGYLVYENYYQGMTESDANPVFSVTKSVMSALTGIAIREGLIENTDELISDYFPDYFVQTDDIQKSSITIDNVLTMTGGLESIDSDYYSYFSSPDLLSYVLQKPLMDNPGDIFAYNTGLTHFLSCIITEKSGMSTKGFADEYLFNKVGIDVHDWDTDNSGNNAGGFGISMKPEDMAKFGLLYLNNGSWDGTEIIPEEWVIESTQKQIPVDETKDYGYLFWLETIRDEANNKEYFTYRAAGYGGQYIMVIPDLDMVVVVTANSYCSSMDGSDTLDIITDYVIPAVNETVE